MKFKRIDAFDVNFVDSAARNEFKLGTSTGTGESRIYIGSEEKKYDDFFDLENVQYFFTEKKDLLSYLDDSKQEYMFPTLDYRSNVFDFYDTNVKNTNLISDEIIKFQFRKKWDNQNRYFLVLKDGIENNRRNYNYIKNICLPRVTKFCFIKLEDIETKKIYIYLRPIFFNDIVQTEEYEILTLEDSSNDKTITKDDRKKNHRIKQGTYRQALLDVMPFCPFTMVADDRILIACHIKPFADCSTDEERYDPKNGITMTPTYHTLFDLGFISFENNGKLLVSPFLSNTTKLRLNLKEGSNIRIQSGSDKYLEYHRENIFCKMPSIILDDSSVNKL